MTHSTTPFGPSLSLNVEAKGRDNNLDLVRLICAVLVLFGHGFIIFTNEPNDPNPLIAFIYNAQQIGLDVFFILSGFLISASALRTQDALTFWISRIARIVPGLLVVSVFCAIIVGPMVTKASLSAYFAAPAVPVYILGTGLLALPDLRLPEVFADAPNPNDVNLSIWTLRYEIILYVGTWVAALFGLLTRRSVLLVIPLTIGYAAAVSTELHYQTPLIGHVLRFSAAFGLGTLAWLHRDRIPLSWVGAGVLIAAALLLRNTPMAPVLSFIASGYVALMIGYAVPVLRVYQRAGDLSYGVYIYHWPIGSLLYALIPDISPIQLTAVTLSLTLVFALASWRFIELPALIFARSAANRLRLRPGSPKTLLAYWP